MRICAYRGYATRTRVLLSGRVLANRAPGELRDAGRESLWRNLKAAYHRFETDEVPQVRVTVRFEGEEYTVETDAEGYYHLELPRVGQGDAPWLSAEAHCTVRSEELAARHEIIAPTEPEFGVISDLDDTVIETNVTSFLTAAKLTFIGNAKTRKPLHGVAALYASLASGRTGRPVNPIFYVSSSPWNLYDLLCEFMEINEVPKGPLFLRDYDLRPRKLLQTRDHRQKLERTLKIMADFPELPFILIGDSGQHDAELYAEAATLHGDRLKAIYIRDVEPTTATSRDERVREHIRTATRRGVPMLLAPNSEAMAHHAAELGLIPARKEIEVQADVKTDQERPGPGAVAVTKVLGTS